MLQSDLVEDLLAFTEEDKARLMLFLDSPYFQDGENCNRERQFLLYLLTSLAHPKEEERVLLLERKQIFKAIFGLKDFNEGQLNRLQYAAAARLRAFIQMEATGRVARKEEVDLAGVIDFFLDRGATEVAARYVRQLKRHMQQWGSIGHETEQKILTAHRTLSRFHITVSNQGKDSHLPEALEVLEHLYLMQRADLLLTLLNLEAQRGPLEVSSAPYVAAFFRDSQGARWFETETGRLYATALRMMAGTPEESQAAFDELMRLFIEYQEKIEDYERERLEALLFNFCVRHFGQQKYREHLLQFYLHQANKLTRSPQGFIRSDVFISLMRMGLYVKDLNFVRKLIEQCQNKVYGPDAPAMYHKFALAHLAFEEGNYLESLALLRTTRLEDLTFQYILRVLEIKNAYELGDHTMIESRLHAMRIALERDRQRRKSVASQDSIERKRPCLPPRRYEDFKNFHQIVQRLWRIATLPSKAGRQKKARRLQEYLQNLPSPIEAHWLRSKLGQLQEGALTVG
ncbi:MAG: hypothetical protein RMJ33_06350 [Saprospiraceae bacterium]|nr:hypothetical protein [Saprospiraceae bacterium]MDW8229441.1 hypothetical protein [Saprospiraceae bacterium]